MADDPGRTRYKPEYSDKLNPPRSERPIPISEQQKQLWHALHDYCRDHGAWIVSVPEHRELRIECRKDSALPVKLAQLGYSPRCCETRMRAEAGKFVSVDVIAFVLPTRK